MSKEYSAFVFVVKHRLSLKMNLQCLPFDRALDVRSLKNLHFASSLKAFYGDKQNLQWPTVLQSASLFLTEIKRSVRGFGLHKDSFAIIMTGAWGIQKVCEWRRYCLTLHFEESACFGNEWRDCETRPHFGLATDPQPVFSVSDSCKRVRCSLQRYSVICRTEYVSDLNTDANRNKIRAHKTLLPWKRGGV